MLRFERYGHSRFWAPLQRQRSLIVVTIEKLGAKLSSTSARRVPVYDGLPGVRAPMVAQKRVYLCAQGARAGSEVARGR
jgi:hypothetical protein